MLRSDCTEACRSAETMTATEASSHSSGSKSSTYYLEKARRAAEKERNAATSIVEQTDEIYQRSLVQNRVMREATDLLSTQVGIQNDKINNLQELLVTTVAELQSIKKRASRFLHLYLELVLAQSEDTLQNPDYIASQKEYEDQLRVILKIEAQKLRGALGTTTTVGSTIGTRSAGGRETEEHAAERERQPVDPVLSSTHDVENHRQEQEPKKAAAINDERRHFTDGDDEEDTPTVTAVAADLLSKELPLPLSYYFPVPAVVPPVAGGAEDQDTTTTISGTKPSLSTAFSNVARRAHCFPSTTAKKPEEEETSCAGSSSKLTKQEFETLDDANKVLSSTANNESSSYPSADRMMEERDDNLLESPDDTTDLVLPKKTTDSPPSPDDINLLLMMNPAAGSSSPPPSQQELLLAKKAETMMKPNFASSAAPVVPKRVRHFQQHNYHDHSRNVIIIAATTNKSSKMIESTSTPSIMSRSATTNTTLATTTQSSCRQQLVPSSAAPLTRPRRVGARLVTSEDDEEQKQQEHQSQQTKGARRGPRGGVMVPFPDKLHHMLANVEQFGLSHIVSWQPHGRCFVVRDTKEFVLKILPIYFKQSKFTSFQRQLNLYGFRRLGSGPDRGGYYHELFLRGMPLLYKSMLRVRIKGRTKASCDPSTEPNFYAMPPIVAAITDSSSNDHDMKRVDGK